MNNKFQVNYYYNQEKIDYKYETTPVVYENKNIITKNQIISSITEIRKVEEDGWIGYGAKYEVKKGDCVATFDAGYINGISRKIKKQHVYVEKNDKSLYKCKIIGNISMDQTTILLENINDFSVGNRIIVAKNKKYIKKYSDIFFMKENRNCLAIRVN
jgi:alanine racemase